MTQHTNVFVVFDVAVPFYGDVQAPTCPFHLEG